MIANNLKQEIITCNTDDDGVEDDDDGKDGEDDGKDGDDGGKVLNSKMLHYFLRARSQHWRTARNKNGEKSIKNKC